MDREDRIDLVITIGMALMSFAAFAGIAGLVVLA